MVDKLLILRKLSDLELYQKQINEYSGLSLEAYDADWKTQRIVERTLQILIEICIDIAHHIISDMNFRLPATYSDTFKVLEENGIIEKQLYTSMENMAKIRNIIVHQYEKINSEIVIAILRKHLNDFELFRNSILSFTKKAE